ncbi:MAG: hypothetical protein HQL94_11095 [Magnetococcales bacterium]|nr:hypothetical protein [Magnetococcales bacterium]MBF0439589.1 hypothetical protein [Magnetococcales bacterium]
MKKTLASICVVVGLAIAPVIAQASIHRKACETPYQGVSVCWDAISEESLDLSEPLTKLHLLPIARQIAGQPEVLVDMSRMIFRQLLPGHLADQLIPEWTPVYHLDGAVTLSQRSGWPAVLWISPREIRNSSATSSGLLDLDVYLLSKGRLLHTLRIRVESRPDQKSDGVERAAVMGSALVATGSVVGAPIGSLAAVAGAYAMGQSSPPEAGKSLELMTELAVRQLLFLFQQPLENMPTAKSETGGNPWSSNNVLETLKRPFAAK